MKIRSITAFVGHRPSPADWKQIGRGLQSCRSRFTDLGYEVQTLRAALPPLGDLDFDVDDAVEAATRIESEATGSGIDYLSLGPWRPADDLRLAAQIPEMIDATEALFATLRIDDNGRLSLPAVRAATECIVRNAVLRDRGFGNLRFAALANVGPGVPFLPAAYAQSGEESFALALESADLARNAFTLSDDVDAGARRLTQSIESHASRLESCAESLARDLGWTFGGSDFSLAPFPGDADSVGSTLESILPAACGDPGTALAAAVLTSAVQAARFRRAGFNGLFLPVLEDSTLAARAASGDLRLEGLLLASTVCGTGLDTLPLPGDLQPDDLVGTLLDLGAVALRLDKALTARLMPMPGLRAGDALDFDFPFFAPGRVMDLERSSQTEPRVLGEWISIARRSP